MGKAESGYENILDANYKTEFVLKSDYDTLKSEITLLEVSNASIEKQNSELVGKIAELKSELSAKDVELNRITKMYDGQAPLIDVLQNRIKECETMHDIDVKYIEELEHENAKLEHELAEAKGKLRKAESFIALVYDTDLQSEISNVWGAAAAYVEAYFPKHTAKGADNEVR
jgi:chromosome segregation ATPase